MFDIAQTLGRRALIVGSFDDQPEARMPPRMNDSSTPRQISAELGSILLDTLGLPAAIEWHAHLFQKRTGVPCALTVDAASPVNLPEEYAATVFEFYNEALSNVARHAMASRVAVALTITPREATVKVSFPLG